MRIFLLTSLGIFVVVIYFHVYVNIAAEIRK